MMRWVEESRDYMVTARDVIVRERMSVSNDERRIKQWVEQHPGHCKETLHLSCQ